MTAYRKAAPVRQHRNGQTTQSYQKFCISIVHKIPRLVQRLLIGAGAGGLGLAVGTALPPLLGLCPWRPGPVALGLALLALGAWAEVSE